MTRRGVTLTELLIVIGIIALMLAVLLPALGRARRGAAGIRCASNQRQIVQAMLMYAGENRYAIPGSPNTTGLHLMTNPTYSDDHCPERISIFDYKTPLAPYLETPFNAGAARADRLERLAHLNDADPFLCPENAGVIATPFSAGAPAVQWNSYSTGILFLYRPYGASIPGYGSSHPFLRQRIHPDVSPYNRPYRLPRSYTPRLTKIGSAGQKAFLADGARYARGLYPTYNASIMTSTGGDYADYGPFTVWANAFMRHRAPENVAAGQDDLSGIGPDDTRVLWARHGARVPGGRGNDYRLNVAFYDGRVQSMGDLEASNPVHWAPVGTRIRADEFWADTMRTHVSPDGAVNIDDEGYFKVPG